MKIIVDAMGGDHAEACVRGAAMAAQEPDISLLLVGNEARIEEILSGMEISREHIEIMDAQQEITNEDDPIGAIRFKKGSSMVLGLKALAAGEGDAFVSAGNTGAVIAGATLLLKRIEGIRRVALAPTIPTKAGSMLLLDAGANVDCSGELISQFGLMGGLYAEHVMGIENPRVGLLNIGVEEHKGSAAVKEAYQLLQQMPINFVGNIEPRDLLEGKCDVLTADGFAGNVVLKTTEGLASFFMGALKEIFYANTMTKLSALPLKKGLSAFKKQFDYKEHGGAPVLGADGVVVKAHGSSDEKAFYQAVLLAKRFVEADITGKIKAHCKKI